ncbi:hypothetical protein JAAARDRAFT_403246 [Jaapia argillacea MUCL 33604]|uniref:Uncharacterized protein n=1 Tax=Jaapia argillacea MUCL 33604 TaxID=933084 RepID=A0A067PV92_9AGAM|nr:hypothetical protein JAAARDRAFT_403246 [Jaapia argillacea MUCL 33604]
MLGHALVVLPLSRLSPDRQRRNIFVALVFIILLFTSTLALLIDTPISDPMTYCLCFIGLGVFRPFVWSQIVIRRNGYLFLVGVASVFMGGALGYSWKATSLLARGDESVTLDDEGKAPRSIAGSPIGEGTGGADEGGKASMELAGLTFLQLISHPAASLNRQSAALIAHKMRFIVHLTTHLASVYVWCLLLVSGEGWWGCNGRPRNWVGIINQMGLARYAFKNFMKIIGMFRKPSGLGASSSPPKRTGIDPVGELGPH